MAELCGVTEGEEAAMVVLEVTARCICHCCRSTGTFPSDCPMLARNIFFFISVKLNFKPEEFQAEANF